MKKFFTTICLSLMTSAMFAQVNPNRMVVLQKNGGVNGYLVERIDSVVFKKIDGRVAADIEVHGFNPDGKNGAEIGISVTQTEKCKGFRIGIASKLISNTLVDDAAVAEYLTKMGTDIYKENFVKATLSGMNTHFVPGVEYTVMSIAYDEYGIPCTGVKADFMVPDVDLVGNPKVRYEVAESKTDLITLDMVPNEDCYGYYTCLFEPGVAEEQIYTYGPIMGLACMEDYVKTFGGVMHEGPTKYTWNCLKPDREYELLLLPIDVNENYGELVRDTLRTARIGGDGVAEVSISFGGFAYDSKHGYVQQVTFKPNEDCAAHRDLVVPKRLFDDGTWTDETYIEYMKSDVNPDNPNDPFWDNYGVDIYNFKAKQNATYYGFSIGKNAKGEFGPVTKVEYTTPSEPNAQRPATVNASSDSMVKEGDIVKHLNNNGKASYKMRGNGKLVITK